MNCITVNNQRLSEVIISLIREKPSDEALVLAYMLEYSNSKFFSCRKGSRKLAIKRLRISNKRWECAIKELRKLGLIKKYHNANGSSYIFYGIEGLAKKMIGREELLINLSK